jgi:membrane fusion protein (multidrug efflux system)
MFARVELVKTVFENALLVPLYAVIAQNNERFVFVEIDGHAKKKPVSLGVLTGWQVQISSGLTAGDRVVIVGHRLLSEGHSLEVIKNVTKAEEILLCEATFQKLSGKIDAAPLPPVAVKGLDEPITVYKVKY